MSREDAPNRFVWCVFALYNNPKNDRDYDVLSDIFDCEEKAITRMRELEQANLWKPNKCFEVERVEIK